MVACTVSLGISTHWVTQCAAGRQRPCGTPAPHAGISIAHYPSINLESREACRVQLLCALQLRFGVHARGAKLHHIDLPRACSQAGGQPESNGSLRPDARSRVACTTHTEHGSVPITQCSIQDAPCAQKAACSCLRPNLPLLLPMHRSHLRDTEAERLRSGRSSRRSTRGDALSARLRRCASPAVNGLCLHQDRHHAVVPLLTGRRVRCP